LHNNNGIEEIIEDEGKRDILFLPSFAVPLRECGGWKVLEELSQPYWHELDIDYERADRADEIVH
jgi:hypothetical protein